MAKAAYWTVTDVEARKRGWPDGFEIKDKVLLKSNLTGEEKIIHEKDARLYELDINEGDEVFLIEGELRKLR